MGLSIETLRQLTNLLRPMSTRVANMVKRGTVSLVNDSKMLQLLQVGALAGETVEGEGGAEHFQPYGLTSVPLEGAEAAIIFPNGDSSHPIVVATCDRRYRPTGGNPGEVTVYNNTGAKVTMTKDGDILLQPAPGRKVLLGGASATDPGIKGNAFMSAMNTLLASISSAVGAVPGGATGAADVTAAATVFDTASSTFLSTDVAIE